MIVQLLILETLHADPHWGNYLFGDDGTIGLVDFGCVKRLGPEVVGRLRQSMLYPGHFDSPEFRRMVQEQFGRQGRALTGDRSGVVGREGRVRTAGRRCSRG